MCQECKAKRRAAKLERFARAAADPSILERVGHGTATAYNYYGCRCRICKDGEADRSHRYYWTGSTV